MDKVELEITVISAEDLKNVRKFGRFMRTYAVVWSDPTTQNSTRIDRDGGRYPTWNEKLQIPVSQEFVHQRGSAVVIQIYCKTMLGKKQVGWAKMPFSDILEGYGTPYSIHFLSYRVRMPGGRPRGTINLSVRFLQKINDRCQSIPAPQCRSKFQPSDSKPVIYNLNQPSSSYSSLNNYNSDRKSQQQQQVHNAALNGYAIGVPLSIVQNPQFNSYMQQPQQQATQPNVLNANCYSSTAPVLHFVPSPVLSYPETQQTSSVRHTPLPVFSL